PARFPYTTLFRSRVQGDSWQQVNKGLEFAYSLVGELFHRDMASFRIGDEFRARNSCGDGAGCFNRNQLVLLAGEDERRNGNLREVGARDRRRWLRILCQQDVAMAGRQGKLAVAIDKAVGDQAFI